MRRGFASLVLICYFLYSFGINKPPQLFYYSSIGELFGPYDRKQVEEWYYEGYFPPDTPVTEDPSSGIIYSIQSLFYNQNMQPPSSARYETRNDQVDLIPNEGMEDSARSPESIVFERDIQDQEYDEMDEYQYQGLSHGYQYENEYRSEQRPKEKKRRWSLSTFKTAASNISKKLKKIKVPSISRPSIPDLRVTSKSKKSDIEWDVDMPTADIGMKTKATHPNVTTTVSNQMKVPEVKPDVSVGKVAEVKAREEKDISSHNPDPASVKKTRKSLLKYSVKSLPKDDTSAWDHLERTDFYERPSVLNLKSFFGISSLSQLPSVLLSMKKPILKATRRFVPQSLSSAIGQDIPRMIKSDPLRIWLLFTAFVVTVVLEIAISFCLISYLSPSINLQPAQVSIFNVVLSVAARVKDIVERSLLRYNAQTVPYPIFVSAVIDKLYIYHGKIMAMIPVQMMIKAEHIYLVVSSLIIESVSRIIKIIRANVPSLMISTYPSYSPQLYSTLSMVFVHGALQFSLITPLQQSILNKVANLSVNTFDVLSMLWRMIVNIYLAYLSAQYMPVLPVFHLCVLALALLGLYNIPKPNEGSNFESISEPARLRMDYLRYLYHLKSEEVTDRWNLNSYIDTIVKNEEIALEKFAANQDDTDRRQEESSKIFSLVVLAVLLHSMISYSTDLMRYLQLRELNYGATEVGSSNVFRNIFEVVLLNVLKFFGLTISSSRFSDCIVEFPQPLFIGLLMTSPFFLWLKTSAIRRNSLVLSNQVRSSNKLPISQLVNYKAQSPQIMKSSFPRMPTNKAIGIIIKDTTITRNSTLVDMITAKDLNIHFKAGEVTVLYHQSDVDRLACENIFDAIYGYDKVSKYYDKNGGIIIQGRKVEDWDCKSLQECILYHKQYEPHLFIHASASAGWLPDSTDDVLQQHRLFAKILGIDQLIRSLPQGFGTILNENLALSESQWHSLAVCRALTLMSEKDIAMLSYPFCYMADNEEQVSELFQLIRIRAKKQQQVVILSTQSKFVADQGDKIITLEKGRIVNIDIRNYTSAEG